jgi:serine/threonine protein kinase
MVRHAALGLAAAHAQGLIHRDIKPSNLLLSKQGQVKVLDLGLARLLAEEHQPRQLTQSGQVLGTPDFMAPEQWDDTHAVDRPAGRDQAIDTRSAIIFYLANGQAHRSQGQRPWMPRCQNPKSLGRCPRLRCPKAVGLRIASYTDLEIQVSAFNNTWPSLFELLLAAWLRHVLGQPQRSR